MHQGMTIIGHLLEDIDRDNFFFQWPGSTKI